MSSLSRASSTRICRRWTSRGGGSRVPTKKGRPAARLALFLVSGPSLWVRRGKRFAGEATVGLGEFQGGGHGSSLGFAEEYTGSRLSSRADILVGEDGAGVQKEGVVFDTAYDGCRGGAEALGQSSLRSHHRMGWSFKAQEGRVSPGRLPPPMVD